MHHINAMTSAFGNMFDYINMWRAVMINEQVDYLDELARDPTTWVAQLAPQEPIVELDYGPDAGPHCFKLDSYKDSLNSPKVITFSRRYYVGLFIAKAETQLRELDIVVLRS